MQIFYVRTIYADSRRVLPWQPEKVLKPIVAFEPKPYFLFQFECLTLYNYTPNQVTYL